MRTVNLQAKCLTNIVIPKIPHNTISFVNQDLTQAYLEATHRLVCFYFRRKSSRQMTQTAQNSLIRGQCERAVIRRQYFESCRAGALLTRSCMYIYILRRPIHMHFKHKHSCACCTQIVPAVEECLISQVLPSLTGSDQVT